MLTAAFDTADGIALAVAEDNEIIFSTSKIAVGRRKNNDMGEWLWEKLDEAQILPAQITKWTVGTGPGSFVGLRSGIAMIKGICTQSAAQMRGLPTSLATALTANIANDIETVFVLNDARQNEVITSQYSKNKTELQQKTEPSVMTSESLENLSMDNKTVFVSTQTEIIKDRLPEKIKNNIITLDNIDAGTLINPVGYPWPNDFKTMQKSLEPVYVRPPVFIKPSDK